MKGTEKIIAHIQSDAKAKADSILADAQEKCKEIRREYDEKAREAYLEKIRSGVKFCEELADNSQRLAQMESKKDILLLKQEMVSLAFEKAKEKIVSMSDEEYSAFLTKLAVNGSDDKCGEIVFNSRDRVKFGESVVKSANDKLGGGKLTLSAETGDFAGGLIVKNGPVEANNTVELLIDMSKSEISSQVAKALFQ